MEQTDVRLDKRCTCCNKTITYKDKYKLKRAIKENKCCKSCSITNINKTRGYTKGIKNPSWKSSNEIPFSWFSKYFLRAKRKRKGTITIEDIYNLWLSQNKKCNLSGLEIDFIKRENGITASIDRIDSNKDYTLENVQLVHKDVNLMKNYFNQNYFINICKLIGDNSCEIK